MASGDTLSSDHDVQIRVGVRRDAYVYVIAYVTGSRSAIRLHSVSGRAEAALTRPARVIRLSKTSDLALLRVDDPPAGITPVPIAKTNEIRNGDVVHAVGHPSNGVRAYTPGKIDQVKPGSSWYAGHDLLHRGTVITAELPDDPGGAGAPLFNNRLELVGIGTMPRHIRGLLTGVSVETMRRFLQAPPAQARTSTGG